MPLFLTPLRLASMLARSTKTTKAMLPERCSLRSQVEGSPTDGASSRSVSHFRFLLLPRAATCGAGDGRVIDGGFS